MRFCAASLHKLLPVLCMGVPKHFPKSPIGSPIGSKTKTQFSSKWRRPYGIPKEIPRHILHIHAYMIPVRGSLPPPPPPHGMVPKPAFCSIPHENVVFAVFFAWWVAGAVRNPANSLDFCNQPSENVLFAMFRLRHRGVVPPRPLLFLCQIII